MFTLETPHARLEKGGGTACLEMVNCEGWKKDEHGRFSEKANPVINCELIIGAWENKALNILASEEEKPLNY